MNKKIVTLILVILISFCFLSNVVADTVAHDDVNTQGHDKTINKDKVDKNKTTDKNNKTDKNKTSDKNGTADKNKTDDKSKKDYILAKGKGNDIKFSDGSRGFILDYSKSPASSGDEFKRVSTSHASNSNTLKLAIIECYKQDSAGQIGNIMADFVKTGSSSTRVGEVVAASHESVGNHEVVKIDNHTEAVFDFEVLKSVSGNESDYFAYKVSFRTIDDGEKDINQTNDLILNVTNTTNTTNTTNVTNTTNATNTTNVTNTTNATNITQKIDNKTNATFLNNLYRYMAFLANALYDSWKPIADTLINDFLMIANALEGLEDLFEGVQNGMLLNILYDYFTSFVNALYGAWKPIADSIINAFLMFVNALETLARMFENFMAEIHSLMDAFGKLLKMLESLWKEFVGILKLLDILWNALVQLFNFIESLLNFLAELISALISLIQQLLDLLFSLINFLIDLLYQLLALLQAILDFLKSVGSFLINVIENAVIIITVFVIVTIGAFVYNRIR